MTMIRSFSCYSLRRFSLLRRYESNARFLNPLCLPEVSTFKHRHCFSLLRGMHWFNGDHAVHSNLNAETDRSLQPATPNPPKFSFPTWARWVLGSILSLILPFWKKKWEKIQRIEGEVEKVAEIVETTVEVVEKVAEVAEKVSSEVADKLPDDGKLKGAVLLVERASKQVAEDAQQAIDFIHKVDELRQEVETLIEPVEMKGK